MISRLRWQCAFLEVHRVWLFILWGVKGWIPPTLLDPVHPHRRPCMPGIMESAALTTAIFLICPSLGQNRCNQIRLAASDDSFACSSLLQP